MNLSKIKLKKPYEDYKTSFKKAIESDTGHKIEDILRHFRQQNIALLKLPSILAVPLMSSTLTVKKPRLN